MVLSALQKLFNFMRFHLLIVDISACAIGVLFRKLSPIPQGISINIIKAIYSKLIDHIKLERNRVVYRCVGVDLSPLVACRAPSYTKDTIM